MAAGVTLPSPLRANRDSDKRSEIMGPDQLLVTALILVVATAFLFIWKSRDTLDI